MELPSPVLLIAEDDPAIRQLLQEFLEDEGYTVALACEGSQVIAQLHNTKIDLLLLDVRLPGLNGLEFCQKVRGQEQLSHTHQCIILLTALAAPDDIIACKSAGADDLITKPFDLEDLLSRIKQAISTCNEPKPSRVLEPA